MNLVRRMGIVSCPGGSLFAEKIKDALAYYVKRFHDEQAQLLAEKYHVDQKTLQEEIRRMEDIFLNDVHLHKDVQRDLSSKVKPEDFHLPVRMTRFSNGEFKAELEQSVRGFDVYVVQDCSNTYPVYFDGNDQSYEISINDHIFCLLNVVDACYQAMANSVTVVIPAYPYARQDRREGREPLIGSRFGKILEILGVHQIITLDIHSRSIENAFSTLRLDSLRPTYQILMALKDLVSFDNPDLVIVAPDTGALTRNKFYASSLKKPLALLYKERDYSLLPKDAQDSNIVRVNLLGDVEGKIVFMSDDILGTGGTLLEAMKILRQKGAKQIIVAISLPFFNNHAMKFFDQAYEEGLFYRIIGTDAVYHGSELRNREWYIEVSVARLFAHVLWRVHNNAPLQPLLGPERIQSLIREQRKGSS